MQSLFGFDLPTAQKWVIAFGVILVLLVLLGLFARQIKDGRLRIKGQGGGRTRQPRLGVVDIHDLDRQRQLVLIRRDNVEHLVMIGGPSDVVVETNIVRSGQRTAMPLQPDMGMPDRPLPFDSLVPQEPSRQESSRQESGRQEPGRNEPVRHDVPEDPRRTPPPAPVALAPSSVEPPPNRTVSRAPQTLTQAQAAVAAATAAGGLAAVGAAIASRAQAVPVSPAPAGLVPNFTRDHAPAPAASAGELDEMTRQLDEAIKRPFSAVRPANALADSAVAVAPADVVAPMVVAPTTDTQVEPVAAAVTAPAVVAPVPTAKPLRVVPADVEAELEMALGLKPERTSYKPPSFAPPVFSLPVAEPVTPPQPAMPPQLVPAAELEPIALPEPVAVEPKPEPAMDDDAAFAAAPQASEDESDTILAEHQVGEAEIVSHESVSHEPAPAESAPQVAVRDEPPPVEPEPEDEPKQIDPFSVDAIEAEFARLLGRDPKPRG